MESLLKENASKEELILKLQITIDGQESNIVEIERELEEMNRFYQKRKADTKVRDKVINDVMVLFQIQDENQI